MPASPQADIRHTFQNHVRLLTHAPVSIQISFQHAGDHLRFELTGERPAAGYAEELVAVWQRMAGECRASGLERALGVSRIQGAANSMDLYQASRRLPEILAGSVRKVALVILADQQALRANLFAENVAVNRGVNGRVFDEEARALAWLRED